MVKLAEPVSHVNPCLVMELSAKTQAMQSEGVNVCNLSIGEPDFDTPEHIKAAAKEALDRGKTKYGPAGGESELREAIAHKLRTENDLDYDAKNVVVTNGGKQALFNLMLALLDRGDEVIIPSPYWLCYPEMVKLAGGIPKIVATDAVNGHKITPAQLRQAISPKTRLLVLNSPNNPTGEVYTLAEIQAIAEVVVETDIQVVSDEIYEKILYDGNEHISIGSIGSDIFQRTIVINGFAKTYAMTGWRIGFLAGSTDIIHAVTTIQSHSTSNVCSFAQYGALAALKGSQDCVERMRQTYVERRNVMVDALSKIPELTGLKSEGAFYLFPNISQTGLKSQEFCSALLDFHQVAVSPGIVFGADDHIRLAYTTSLEVIEEGMKRLSTFVQSLL